MAENRGYDTGYFYDDKTATLYDDVMKSSLIMKWIGPYTVQQHIPDMTGKSCMDAACGNGDYMKFLLDKGASKVVGSDLSQECLDIAQKRHTADGCDMSKLSYVQHNLDDVKIFEDGPFDLILMNFALEYCSTYEKLISGWLGTAFRNLKPGGQLVAINTRVALPEAEQKETADIGFTYTVDNGLNSFSDVRVEYPNGWACHAHFLPATMLFGAFRDVGFKSITEHPVVADPAYKKSEDHDKRVGRLAELVPYNMYVATRTN